jgi:type IV pilus assembly protein PilV
MKIRPRPRPSSAQQGFMLIEALFGILLFSIGIIALVGMQGTAIKQSVDGKYRTDASLLANQLLGQMWASSHVTSALQADFNTANITNGSCNSTCTPAFRAWVAELNSTLPGASANPPSIVITQTPGSTMGGPTGTGGGPSSHVVLTLFWQTPGDTTIHKYLALAEIK